MSNDPTLDLNATITAAVNARIEAEMMKALSGDATIGSFVTAALQQQVEVPKKVGYGTERVPFLRHVLCEAIRKATEDASRRLVEEEMGSIEDAVRKALRRDVGRIAETMSKSLADAAARAYGFNVTVDLRMPGA